MKQIFEAWAYPIPNIGEYIRKKKIKGTLYVWAPQEPTFPWDGQRRSSHMKYKHKCKLIFVVGNYIDIEDLRRITGVDKIECIQYRTIWFDVAYTQLSKANNPNPYDRTNYKFDKLFISLNSVIREHRTYFVDMLFKYKLDGHLSFLHIDRTTIEQFKYWDDPRVLRLQDKEHKNVNYYLQNLPNQWYRAPIHLISETFHTPLPNGDIDISEKTTFPLLMAKPFLVAGPANFHKHLQDLGFELYTEIFDYSFDSIENYEERVDAMIKMVSNLQYKSYDELYDKCFAKAKRNAEYYIYFMNKRRPKVITDMADQLPDWITLNASTCYL